MPDELSTGYRILNETTLPVVLGAVPQVAAVLGGLPQDWHIREVGDGNLNLVFLVEGPRGGVCVKQALPYVRAAGESWPMPPKRAWYEQRCMQVQAPHAAGRTPRLHHYDSDLYLIVMELLQPHTIMRWGMINAVRYPLFVEHITDYMARTLFFTSDLALPAGEKKALIAEFCGNSQMCRITEDLIFTDPYMECDRNRWTSPQLDRIAAAIRADGPLKRAISDLKLKFLSEAQALLHGDLHTGSIMVTEDDTRVIDTEFAFFGPMGFDVGAVIANLLINYFAQDGHATADQPRDDYQDWVLEVVEAVWTRFHDKFCALWDSARTGDAYPRALFEDAGEHAALKAARDAYMDGLWRDTLGFAAAKMIRRIVGFAHNIDLDWIEDPDVRARCEARCLRLARAMMVETGRFAGVHALTAEARRLRAETPAMDWLHG